MSSKEVLTKRLSENGKKLALFTLTLIIVYGICATAVVSKRYNLEPGDIARADIKANRDVVDEQTTNENIQEAASKVEKKYNSKTNVKKDVTDNVLGVYNQIIKGKSDNKKDDEILNDIAKNNNNVLSNDEIKTLVSISAEDLEKIADNNENIIAQVYSKNIMDDKDEDMTAANTTVDQEVDSLSLKENEKEVVKKLINKNLKPNLEYDREQTEEQIKDIKQNVPKVIIKKNQTVVKDGEVVTERQIAILKELHLVNEENNLSNILLYVILFCFVFIIMGLQSLYIFNYHKKVYNSMSQLKLISALLIISLLLARGISLINPFLIPIATTPLLLTLLVNFRLSIVVSVLNSILIGSIVEFRAEVIILSIAVSILGATALKKMQQRNDILYSSIYIALISVVLTFTTGMLQSNVMIDVLKDSALAATGSILSGILAVGLLPFFENSFDVLTTVKLLELSNPNNPLLKKLLMEAPGTYHHSVLVANLAELAAEEVGGNPVLARVGAYYHDVGKTERPYFFKENQFSKENPHDKITANLSTLIITSHVKEGVELAKEYDVPAIIQDIIAQHHGTTLVKYFYYKAKQNADNPDEIKEEDFRYPGPIPQTKEAAIIMLADSTEAAVRSISEPTKGKIEEMVNNIIKDKLYSGQLDNCDLTLKDLDKVRECFLKTLSGIYHERIEYPTENSIRGRNK